MKTLTDKLEFACWVGNAAIAITALCWVLAQ